MRNAWVGHSRTAASTIGPAVLRRRLVQDRELALLRHREDPRRLRLADGVALAQVAVDDDPEGPRRPAVDGVSRRRGLLGRAVGLGPAAVADDAGLLPAGPPSWSGRCGRCPTAGPARTPSPRAAPRRSPSAASWRRAPPRSGGGRPRRGSRSTGWPGPRPGARGSGRARSARGRGSPRGCGWTPPGWPPPAGRRGWRSPEARSSLATRSTRMSGGWSRSASLMADSRRGISRSAW